MFVLELSKDQVVGICVTDEIKLVGYLICTPYDTDWHLMTIAVAPERQHQGLGRMLLTEMINRLPDGEKARITLEVRKSNNSAITLYKEFGFKAIGIRRGYYQDVGEDAVIMWRSPGTLSGTLDDIPNVAPDVRLQEEI
jgi:ribosomal-protein-alanine N-acetyltransferase